MIAADIKPGEKQSQIYFCDSPGEILLLGRKDINHQKREAIRKLHTLNYWYNLKVPFFIALWITAGILFFRTDSLLIHIPLYFLMTCSMVGLSVLMHESNHNLLFKNKHLNRWTGFICGLPSLVAVSAYRTLHLAHHAHTSTPEDPDSMDQAAPKSVPIVLFYYLFLIIGAYLYLIHLVKMSLTIANTTEKRNNILVEYSLIAMSFFLFFWFIPFSIILHIWLIPLLIAAQLTNVRGLAEHGLTTTNNVFTETRTVTSNRFVSFMMNNLNYHLDHHLFPGIPWYNLPTLHAILSDEYKAAGSSVYPSYTAFLVDFFRVSWSGVIPDVRLIPAHLREDICG